MGIAFNGGAYRTIGCSLELGGLNDGNFPSTKKELVRKMLEFFGFIFTGIADTQREEVLPSEFTLKQNFPNPFNNSTLFRYAVPEPGQVTFTVYSITGQKIYEADSGEILPGRQTVEWSGRNQSGVFLASGIYFYRV